MRINFGVVTIAPHWASYDPIADYFPPTAHPITFYLLLNIDFIHNTLFFVNCGNEGTLWNHKKSYCFELISRASSFCPKRMNIFAQLVLLMHQKRWLISTAANIYPNSQKNPIQLVNVTIKIKPECCLAVLLLLWTAGRCECVCDIGECFGWGSGSMPQDHHARLCSFLGESPLL